MTGLGFELNERQRILLGALVPVFLLLLLNPLLDVVASSWPIRADEVAWRFGFLGLLLAAAVPIATASALLALVGGMLGQRGLVRAMAILLGLLTLAVFGGLFLFGLDALQVRRSVPQAQKDRFDATTFKALAMATLTVPVAGWFALRVLKACKGGAEASADRSAGLVVGQ